MIFFLYPKGTGISCLLLPFSPFCLELCGESVQRSLYSVNTLMLSPFSLWYSPSRLCLMSPSPETFYATLFEKQISSVGERKLSDGVMQRWSLFKAKTLNRKKGETRGKRKLQKRIIVNTVREDIAFMKREQDVAQSRYLENQGSSTLKHVETGIQ